MGRITVFALQDCPHCKRTKAALSARKIPYTEISLSTHPDKRNDMLSLASRLTVPQVFFNDRHIGGADETLKVLAQWDADRKYPNPLVQYQKEIEAIPGPTDPRLAVPTTPPVLEKPPPPRNDKERFVEIPNRARNSVPIADLTQTLVGFMPRADLTYRAKVYKDCFTGRDGVKALMDHYDLSKDDAIKFGRILQRKQILHHVTSDHTFGDTGKYFRLEPFQKPNILNTYVVWTERVDPDAMGLLARLKKLMGKIESDVTDDEGLVDYLKAAKHESWLLFEEQVSELQGVSMSSMRDEEKLAFGINLYNLMIKHAFIKVGIASTNLQRYSFFNNVAYDVGGDVFTFSELENGVLRANSVPPYQFSAPFGKSDPRRGLVLSKVDPRIHFALNCGAKSCPPVKKFSAISIDEELRIVAQAFCEQDDNVAVNMEKHELSLSMILNWYLPDFAGSLNELPSRIVTYLRGEKKEKLQEMIDSGRPVAVKFNTYDWGTNAKKSKAFEGSDLVPNEVSIRAFFSGLGL